MSEFDRDLKVGDLVFAYKMGVHRVTKIERRFYRENRDIPFHLRATSKVGDEYSSLVYSEIIMDKDFNSHKKARAACCDAAYCVKITPEEIQKLRDDLRTRMARLDYLETLI